jgi:hypothetical protein
MSYSENVDMAAIRRVASRVDLQSIVLIELKGRRTAESPGGSLKPRIEHSHEVALLTPSRLMIESKYKFEVRIDERVVIDTEFAYLLSYAVVGEGPIAETDLKVFAQANGAYHSWPFVRELLHTTTSRMGYPPFVLPVLTFKPPRRDLASKPSPKPRAREAARRVKSRLGRKG